jgi:putative nucleotidyltransferase with HDIG domain
MQLMSMLLKLIERNSLKSLLQLYSEGFATPVFLFDTDKSLLLQFPGDRPLPAHVMRAVTLRDSTVGYVAVPTENASEAPLDFISQNLAQIAGMRYEIESLSGEVARNYEELSLLWRLSSRLGTGLDVTNICNVLADEVMHICPSNNVFVLLVNEPGDTTASCAMNPEDAPAEPVEKSFVPRIALGADAGKVLTRVFDPARGLLGQVFVKKEPLTVCDVNQDERFEGLPFPVTRIMGVPLTVEDTVIGVVVATDKLNGEEYYSTEIKLVHSIASECASSIKKALLYEEIRHILFSVTESFALAIDAKDPYTYGHSKRVAETAASVAVQMGFSSEAVHWIRLAALLHDVGKIGTPENILRKNGSLSEDEMGRIREHPIIGAKMIEHISRMGEVAQWICHHHEKYDGTGYPAGLAQEKIPVPSKIIAVADYYDALTSDRPYRKTLSKEEALDIMKKLVGIQFDPAVFEYFEKVIPDGAPSCPTDDRGT